MAGLRQRRCAGLVMLWLLGAALLSPLNEVGDLLESVAVPRSLRWAGREPGPAGLHAHPVGGGAEAPSDTSGMVPAARYVMALGPKADLRLALEPLCPVRDEASQDPPTVA